MRAGMVHLTLAHIYSLDLHRGTAVNRSMYVVSKTPRYRLIHKEYSQCISWRIDL